MVKIIEINNISKSYQSPSGEEAIPILKELTMSIAEGEIIAVTAPSGAGKSTLLNLIGGLDRPDSGDILFKGEDIAKFTDSELSKYRNSEIGFIFQEHHLLPQCSVIENVMIPTLPAVAEKTAESYYERAESLLQQVGIADRKNHLPGQISGGERQRTALARALINKPALLLADEPTGSLDRVNSENMIKLLKEVNKANNTSLILVTHSESLADMADRKLNLVDGGF